MYPTKFQRWTMGIVLAAFITVVPFVYYRAFYAHSKRLRVVTEGKVYRSGTMTAPGFREAISELGIRTVINLMDEAPEPDLAERAFGRVHVSEAALCRELGANFVFIGLDLTSKQNVGKERPEAIEKYLQIMDDPKNYPVLIHCRAGLHRTGCFVALYRMEYENWSVDRAMKELRHHGFGTSNSTSFNDYINQYVLNYQPGLRGVKTPDGTNVIRPASQNIHDPARWTPKN